MKTVAMRIYRRLAYAFPHEFQMVYGADILQLGEDSINDIFARHGLFGLIRLLVDIAIRLPIEYLAEMLQDLAYARRTLAKSPGFAIIGILSLGLGIGISAVCASELFNLVLRDAPGAKNPDQLAMAVGVSYPYFERYRDQHDLFTAATAYQGPVPFNVSLSASSASNASAAVKSERVFG